MNISNTILSILGFGAFAKPLQLSLAAKANPTPETIDASLIAWAEFARSEVPSETVKSEISALEPLLNSVTHLVEGSTAAAIEAVAQDAANFFKTFRPEVPQPDLDNLVEAIKKVLADEGVK